MRDLHHNEDEYVDTLLHFNFKVDTPVSIIHSVLLMCYGLAFVYISVYLGTVGN